MSSKYTQDLFSDAHALHSVGTSRAQDGVWLVKVPKYLSKLWQQPGNEGIVGKVVMKASTDKDGKTISEVALTTDKNVLNRGGEDAELIPHEHQFIIQTSNPVTNTPTASGQAVKRNVMSGQELIVLCESTTDGSEAHVPGTAPPITSGTSCSSSKQSSAKKLSLFGRVVSRAECRPPQDARYMRLKAKQVKDTNKPKNKVMCIDLPLIHFKPTNNHQVNIENDLRKKTEGKNLRRERDEVMQDLFKAFEKHQYYTIKDLQSITKQPVPYLTEILKEIAIFNTKPPHKNTWELKEEYRHYEEPKE